MDGFERYLIRIILVRQVHIHMYLIEVRYMTLIFGHAVAVMCSHARYSVLASTQDTILPFGDIKNQLAQCCFLNTIMIV